MDDHEQVSAYALACDLIGDDIGFPGDAEPRERAPLRMTVGRAARCVQAGEVVAARVRGRDMVVVKTEDGRVFALPDHCPHAGGPLSDGFVDAGRLVCGRHGWELDLASATWLGRPRIETEVDELE